MVARALLMLVSGIKLAQAAPLRLADVLEQVEQRGPEQAVAGAQVALARADVHTARMLPNPGVVFTAGGTEPVFTAGLQLRLPILGQRAAHVRAAEQGVALAAAEAGWTRWRLRHDARVAYYAVARAEEEVAIAIEVERLVRRISDLAHERFEVGSGTRLDERQASLVHARGQQEVSDRRAIARVARLDLARRLGTGLEQLGAIAEPLARFGSTPDLEGLLELARTRHPELRVLLAERDGARLRAVAARADRRPLPSLEIGAEVLNPATRGGGSYGAGARGALTFDLPLLNLNGGPIERAEAEARLAVIKAEAAVVRVDAAVRSAAEALAAATTRALFFDRQYVPNALEVEGMAREGFAAGKTGLLPVIEAERAVLEARLGRTQALFAVQAARADLEEASGVALSAP